MDLFLSCQLQIVHMNFYNNDMVWRISQKSRATIGLYFWLFVDRFYCFTLFVLARFVVFAYGQSPTFNGILVKDYG